MTDLWLDNLHQHEMLTVILAGSSLAVVLVGWVIVSSQRTRFDRILRATFLVFILVMWLITLAGSAWTLIVGG